MQDILDWAAAAHNPHRRASAWFDPLFITHAHRTDRWRRYRAAFSRAITARRDDDAEVVAVMGRTDLSRGKALAQEFGIAFVTERDKLVALRPEIVIEAASHAAVREHVEALLSSGIAVIVLSAGALVDDPCASGWSVHRRGIAHCSTCLQAALVDWTR